MAVTTPKVSVTIGVLALQGAFYEHIKLLQAASQHALTTSPIQWTFTEVRNPTQLSQCSALMIPGGESTTMSLVAARSGLLEPLRDFVKVQRKPTWGTCAGLILLAESANRTKKGGQDLVGGLDVRVNRNHFGRQTESFETDIQLPFLEDVNVASEGTVDTTFRGIFIRAPVVEKILPVVRGVQEEEAQRDDTVVAPSREPGSKGAEEMAEREVEVMGRLKRRKERKEADNGDTGSEGEDKDGDIIAVRQGNVFGTSFHPELTGDARIHVWWLQQVADMVLERRRLEMGASVPIR